MDGDGEDVEVVEEGPSYPYDAAAVKAAMDSVLKAEKGSMYADAHANAYYKDSASTTIWVSKFGVDDRADTLLSWLRDVEQQGLNTANFHVDEISADLKAFRALDMAHCTEAQVAPLLGRLEARLTQAYIRYATGQRFGYIQPRYLYNYSKNDTTKKVRTNFDFDIEQATDSFYNVAFRQAATATELGAFLRSCQPDNDFFNKLCQEYQRALSDSNGTARQRLCKINLERCRWRIARPSSKGKFVFVNLAAFKLIAVDNDKQTRLEMKVCEGKVATKTPMLASQINKLDLNPVWNVPPSIRNEMAGHSSSYFASRGYTAYDTQTGQRISAASLTSEQLRSGRYSLQQPAGPGNALGRLIFRFPNNHAVYLHDTNSPGAFAAANRAVSHGCVRVEKPLDLACFLIDSPDSLIHDKIRIAIDKQPVTEAGQKLKASGAAKMTKHIFEPTIPVFLDYYTLLPEPLGDIQQYDDVYGYDKALAEAMQKIGLL